MKKVLRTRSLLAVLSLLLGCGLTAYRANSEEKLTKDGLQPVQGLAVFDAKGKKVGNVLGIQGPDATIAFRANGELVVANVDFFGFTSHNGGFTHVLEPNANVFFFESSSCVDTPFIPLGFGGTSLAPLHILDGTKLYTSGGPQTNMIVRAQGSGGSCVPAVNPWQSPATPLRLLIDLGTQFQPPFTLR